MNNPETHPARGLWGYFYVKMKAEFSSLSFAGESKPMQKKLTVKIITLFPKFIENFVVAFGIIKRATKLKLLNITAINLRSFGLDARQTVDGRPYGGGVGMVMRADVLYKAIQSAKSTHNQEPRIKTRIILLTPQGKKFTQKEAHRLAKYNQLILVCGRYEGFDDRIRKFVDEEISIGDYVLMGGELPALVATEAIMRLRPGILGKAESAEKESFSENLLEYPQYTKPEILTIGKKKYRVPKVLLTGHHKNVADWRNDQARKRTKKRRPDLVI
jgi:tRNA (guanine37-N1)-methyltransferase